MSTTLTMPEAETLPMENLPLADDAPAEGGDTQMDGINPLISTYLDLIDGQTRRLAAHERAMEEERAHLEDMPRHIADLQARLSTETSPDLVDVLRAKLEEARADYDTLQRRMAERDAAWPGRRAEMLADIDRFKEKLALMGHITA